MQKRPLRRQGTDNANIILHALAHVLLRQVQLHGVQLGPVLGAKVAYAGTRGRSLLCRIGF